MPVRNPPHPGEFITTVYLEPNNLSGRELAATLGVSASTLNRILTNTPVRNVSFVEFSIERNESSMNRSNFLRGALVALLLAVVPVLGYAQADPPKRKPDVADAAEGTYVGNVISDSKGSSKRDVTLTVTRIGANRVRVSSDYPRLPVVEVALTRAMDKILNRGGDTTFLLDRRKEQGNRGRPRFQTDQT